MYRIALLAARMALTVVVLAAASGMSPAAEPPALGRLPEFTQANGAAWLNSPPLKVADLRGRVVLLDVWTFECWNCYRSFPWLRALEAKYAGQGLQVLGVHSPEFAAEHDVKQVAAKSREFGLHHPIMIDNDFAYFRALGAQGWPAYFLVDRDGRIRQIFYGETHAGDPQALGIEKAVGRLLGP